MTGISAALGSSGGGRGMVAPLFVELKKQASFFFKEKIRIARLALTDVTPIQLLTEEVTKGSPVVPDARTMGIISRAAFELEDYWRIVDILHARLERFDSAQWREAYNSLILLEHLLTHGPASVAEEFKEDAAVIARIQSLKHVDERGFDWGLAAKNKSERVLKLLEKGPLLQEERERARKLSRGIQGFGKFDRCSAAPIDSSEMPRESCPRILSLPRDHHHHHRPDHDHDDGHDHQKEKTKIKRYPGKENDVGKIIEKGISAGDESKPLLRHRGGAAMELRRSDPFGLTENHATCV